MARLKIIMLNEQKGEFSCRHYIEITGVFLKIHQLYGTDELKELIGDSQVSPQSTAGRILYYNRIKNSNK
ncbi:MAG: hypothetical protein WKG06_40720 [Segetibacter sp.]